VTTLRSDVRVQQDPDHVWAFLTIVEKIPEWLPAVQEAYFDGVHRHLRTPGGDVKALVVTKDDDLRRFQYRIVEGLPTAPEYHLGTIDVMADGEGSRVIYSQEILPDSLSPILAGVVNAAMEGIGRYFAAEATLGNASA
jgi:Polyketide cyclase / dehydrase and lipid transport